MHLEGSHLRASELWFCRITSLICPTSKSVIRSNLDPGKFRTEQVSDVALDDNWSRRRTKTLGVSGIHLKQMNDKLLSRKNRECSSVGSKRRWNFGSSVSFAIPDMVCSASQILWLDQGFRSHSTQLCFYQFVLRQWLRPAGDSYHWETQLKSSP